MSGGRFVSGVSKVRPGLYANIESSVVQQMVRSRLGVVVFPLVNANWGPTKEFIEVQADAQDAQFSKLGYRVSEPEMLLVREMFKSASKVLLYRPTEGVKATVAVSPLTVTAKYTGTLGNDITVVVASNPVAGKDVSILRGIEVVYEAMGHTNVEDLPTNGWVDFTGTGALVDTAGTKLVGGTNGTQENADIIAYLDDSETQDFNVLAFPFSDSGLQASFGSKIRYFVDEIGKQVRGVSAGYEADYEYISNIENGVILSDGTSLTAIESLAWFSAASAAAMANQSLTYVPYPGAIDVNPRLNNAETIAGLQAGKIIFTALNGQAVVEQDVNTLTTLTEDKDRSFKKNRVIRTFQNLLIRARIALPPNKYDGNDDGYSLIQQDIVTILLDEQANNSIQNVDVSNDVTVDTTLTTGDEYHATIAIQPVDSVEKYYFTIMSS